MNDLVSSYKDDHPNCEVCGKYVMGMPHHIQTRGRGGSDEPDNLITLCKYHHNEVHSGQKTFAIKYSVDKIKTYLVSRFKWSEADEEKFQKNR